MNLSSFIWLVSVFCISYRWLTLYLPWMHPDKNSTLHLHLTPLSFFAHLIDKIFRALGISHARHWTWFEIESNAVKERKKEYTIQDFLFGKGYDDICLSCHCLDINKSSRNELRKVKLPFDSFPIVWSQTFLLQHCYLIFCQRRGVLCISRNSSDDKYEYIVSFIIHFLRHHLFFFLRTYGQSIFKHWFPYEQRS